MIEAIIMHMHMNVATFVIEGHVATLLIKAILGAYLYSRMQERATAD